MPLPSQRRTLLFLLAVSLLAVAPAASADGEPRRVSLRARLRFGGATIEVRGLFREHNTLLSAQSADLPSALSGGYDLVIMARGQSLFVMPVASGEESEGLRQLCEIPGDARLEALDIESVRLYDGGVVIAEDDDVATAARVMRRAALKSADGPRTRWAVLEARARRSHDNVARYEIDVATSRIGPGEYEVRLSGGRGDLVIPFVIPAGRNRARLAIREEGDRVAQFAELETATLVRDGVEIGSSPVR